MDQPNEWHDIFLSHASEDKYLARLIRGYFQQHNIQTWIDVVDAKTRGRTDDEWIEKVIIPSIERCRNFIVLISAFSIEKPWVKREVETALDLSAQGKIDQLAALVIDGTDFRTLEPPFDQLRAQPIYGPNADTDLLRDIREAIGRPSPTYIDDVKPNFIKQLPTSKLHDHITLCDPADVKIWYVHGGTSFAEHVIPGLRALLKKAQGKSVSCTVMLTDSAHLRSPASALRRAVTPEYRFQDRLVGYIREAKFLDPTPPHHQIVEESFNRFNALQQEFENLECSFHLAPRMPAGRVILIGDIAFYGPHIAEPTAALPLMVFDRRSPFFKTVEEHFDAALSEARRWRE